MSINSGDGSDKSSSASGGDTSGIDIERMVNDAVSKALGPRLKRATSSMEEMIAARVSEALAKFAPADPPKLSEPDSDGSPKLTVKALDQRVDTQIKALQTELASERKARADAEAKASQTRLRADLESHFAKHIGSDNPHLKAYLNEYAAQFQHREGNTYRVTKDEFGEDAYVPIDRAAEELFKNELKHLVPQRSANLPPTSIARGMPFTGQGPANGKGLGIFEREVLHAQAMGNPDAYAAYQQQLNEKK